jgi:hypothetical protein
LAEAMLDNAMLKDVASKNGDARRQARGCRSFADLLRGRFGYRRLHILMRREGFIMNHKKLRGLYREERSQVRRRSGRKRARPIPLHHRALQAQMISGLSLSLDEPRGPGHRVFDIDQSGEFDALSPPGLRR